MKIRRIVDNKEPITDGAPLIYGPKGEIMAGHNIRTDRFEIAVEAIVTGKQIGRAHV